MKNKQLKVAICDALEGKLKKLIQRKIKTEKYECICPYCGNNFGIVDDPAYWFERAYGTVCNQCGEEFDIEDKVRNKKIK